VGHFLDILFAWPNGIVVGNLIASVLWTVPTWFILLHHLHCAEQHCYRPGTHTVEGTTYRTCGKHTTIPVHAELVKRHADKRPEQHKLLNKGDN